MWNDLNKGKIFKRYLLKYTFYLTSCIFTLTTSIARSQIIPDNTLPENTVILPDGNVIEINGGTTNGNNLFHSFEQFSLTSETTAIFNNAATIENIFSRVTGGDISNIEGLIKANGTANLFLLNPAGIVFGENAAINIGGSLFVSTADSFVFADNTQFSAVNPETSPLLTVSIPVGLQYGTNPGTITVKGNGHNIFSDPQTSITNRDNRPTGIAVASGKTLALLGGKIHLEGGNVTAESGNIEVWAISNGGNLSIVGSNDAFTIEPSNTAIDYEDINLSQTASIDVSAKGAGSVRLQGNNIVLTDGSLVLSETLGEGDGGILQVNAQQSVSLDGTTPSFDFPTGFLTEIAPGATGQGSDIFINSQSLVVSGGAFISSGTAGTGNSGSIRVNAPSIDLIGGLVIGDTFVAPSGLFSQAFFSNTGNSGNITLNTKNLSVTKGANISTLTFFGGNSGAIYINAEKITLEKTSADFISSVISTATAGGEGNAGSIEVNTAKLVMSDGGQIATATLGEGNAGNLTVNATESVELKGATPQGRTGLFASAFIGTGNGGNIDVNTKQLTIEKEATISVSNFQSRNLFPPGEGAPGNLNITAESLNLNESIITAEANSGSKGNISIVSDNIILRNDSLLTTNARGEATGGNITIRTDTLTAFNNSDITANAVDNFAGRVNITATGIFGTEFRLQPTPQSDITASSALGAEFSGVVQLNTPDVDPASGLNQLPVNTVDPTSVVTAKCPASQLGNTFVITGQGGLPNNPGNNLRGTSVWHDLRLVAIEQGNTDLDIYLPKQNMSNTSPIIEARGWQLGEQGQIILTAQATKVVPTEPIFPYLRCQE